MTSRPGVPQPSDALCRALVESTAAAIFAIARDRFQYVNPAFAALAGYSIDQLLGLDPYHLVHPDSLPDALQRLPAVRAGVSQSGSQSPRWELKIRTRRGDTAWLALTTKTIEVGGELFAISAGVDITDAKLQAARPPAQVERDEISQFARGLAHDLNDALQVIQGHADRLSEELGPASPLMTSPDAIRAAADRAAELAHTLMSFSRDLQNEPQAARAVPASLGHPVVLLIDDEAPVRDLIGQVLERYGFEVITAGSGEEGLTLEHERRVDVLVSDIMLPGRNGFEVARQIQQRSPHVRVIFMSGYTGEATRAAAGIGDDTPFLQKPFKMVELVSRVRQVLGEAAGTKN